MKRMSIAVALVAGTAALGGCVVQPVGPAYVEPAYAPAGVAYVAPTYVMPGPGYAWAYHRHYGWGWHHRGRGWHRGWR